MKSTQNNARAHDRDCVLMDDNARPHRAKIINQFLTTKAITRMDPWPACSPDMNHIDHCWDELGRAVRQRTQPGDTRLISVTTKRRNGTTYSKHGSRLIV